MPRPNIPAAADPTTPPERLAELAHIDPVSVARNPNTSAETLLDLVLEHVDDVVRNPSLPMLVVSNPEAVFRRDPHWFGPAFAILAHPECPPLVLKVAFAQDHSSLPSALLANPNLPLEYLERIFARLKGDAFALMAYGRRFASHPHLTNEMRTWVHPNTNPDLSAGYAENPVASEEELAWIARNVWEVMTPEDREFSPLTLALARNPRSPRDVLEALASQPHAARDDARSSLEQKNALDSTPA